MPSNLWAFDPQLSSFRPEFLPMVHSNLPLATTPKVEKVHLALQRALIDLVLENGYDQVTIQAIVKRAQVSRSTFYGYFNCKEDLLEAAIMRLHRATEMHWKHSLSRGTRQGELAFLRPLIYHLHESRKLWQELRNSSARASLIAGFKFMIGDLVAKDQAFEPPLSASQEAAISCVTGAFLELMDRWLRGALLGTKEEIALQFESAAKAVSRTSRAT